MCKGGKREAHESEKYRKRIGVERETNVDQRQGGPIKGAHGSDPPNAEMKGLNVASLHGAK
jgi:hypothetical protein